MTDQKTQGCSKFLDLAKSTSFRPSGKEPCAPPSSPLPAGSLGSAVQAEDSATGSPLGLSMPKEADLELARLSTPVGFSRLQEPLQVWVFYIKIALLSLWLPTVHFLPGVTFLSRWGSRPYEGSQQSQEAPRQLRSQASTSQLPLFSAFSLSERSAAAL